MRIRHLTRKGEYGALHRWMLQAWSRTAVDFHRVAEVCGRNVSVVWLALPQLR